MEAQTCRDFVWHMYFDKSTPEHLVSKIRQYQKRLPLTVFFTDEFNALEVQNNLASCIDDTVPYIITTRIDNDDTFSFDFTASIQEQFEYQDFEFINFRYGYVLKGGRLYNHNDPSGPFLSLIEKNTGAPKSVWCVRHTDAAAAGPVRQVKKKVWIQIIHGNNVSNRVKSYRINRTQLDDRYIIPGTKEAELPVLVENILLYPVRKIREFLALCIKTVFVFMGLEKLKNKFLKFIKRAGT